MTDEKHEQNPLTVVSNASILLLEAILMTIAESSPEQIKKIKAHIARRRDSDIAKANPRSFDLIEVLLRSLPESGDE